MRKFKTILSLILVLATSGTAWGDAVGCFSVQPLPSPGMGLSSYLIRLGGAKTFTNINLVVSDSYGMPSTQPATVHQVNMFGGFPPKAQKTLFLGEMSPESEPYDTHFMFSSEDILLIGNGANETNNKSSPTGISTDEYGFYYGMGTFTSDVMDGFTLPEALPWGSPFMQVVLPTGIGCWLTGFAVDPKTGESVPIRIEPEPGTIVLLLVGALCFGAMRLRKQRG